MSNVLISGAIALICGCAVSVLAFLKRRFTRNDAPRLRLGAFMALVVLPSAVTSTLQRREKRHMRSSRGQQPQNGLSLVIFLLEILSNGTFLEKERAVAWCQARMMEFDCADDVAFFLKITSSISEKYLENFDKGGTVTNKEGISLFFTTISMRLGLSKVEVDPESLLDWLATEAAGHNSIAQYGWRPIGILRRFCDAISARTCRRRSHNSGMSAIEFKALNIGVRIIQSLPELPLRGLLALICSLDSLAFKAVQDVFIEILPRGSIPGITAKLNARAATVDWLRGKQHPYGQGSNLSQAVLACICDRTQSVAILASLPRMVVVSVCSTFKAACLGWRVERARADLLATLDGSSTPVLPRHVGMIMDGNRRWARHHGLAITDGHEAGTRAAHELLNWWVQLGRQFSCIQGDSKPVVPQVLSLFTLSVDNFKRAPVEVNELIQLIAWHLKDIAYTPFIHLHRIRIRVVQADGVRGKLTPALCEAIDLVERVTASYGGDDGFELLYLIGYDGRMEVLDAVRDVVQAGDELTNSTVSSRTACGRLNLPPVDLIVRSSGIMRTSGFFLWDTRAAEMSFIECLWPDLSEMDWLRSCLRYSQRESLGGA